MNFDTDEEAQAVSAMLFQQLDLDNDEMLVPDEIEAARELMISGSTDSRGGMHGGDLDDKVSALLEDIDTDGDGHVSRQEWTDFLRSLYEVVGRREFLRHSGSWAAGLHQKLALPRSIGPAVAKPTQQSAEENKDDDHIVMQKYQMSMRSKCVRQQTRMCIGREGKVLQRDTPVLIKVYKPGKAGSKQEAAVLQSFQQQVAILQKLQGPFTFSDDSEPCDPRLAFTQPSDLFVQLLDFSRDWRGDPGPDPIDDNMYIVTELHNYTLQEYIADLQRRQEKSDEHVLSTDALKILVQSMILVIAGLHAKGLVHLNLQPQNLVVLQGHLKLVDTEGCTELGATLNILDSTLSFSPCYCSPEWARFMTDEENSTMTASSVLDVWALGLIICELVVLQPIMCPMYRNFSQHGCCAEEAAMLFMEWLACLKSVPLPKAVGRFDADLEDFLLNCMLILDPSERKILRQCLAHHYVSGNWSDVDLRKLMPNEVYTDERGRTQDETRRILYQGTLWKLNRQGDPKESSHWLIRDMWVASNGSLCYFSQKENKRLVLLDASLFSRATLQIFDGGVYEHAFQIRIVSENEGEDDDVYTFACNASIDVQSWLDVLKQAVAMNSNEKVSMSCLILKDFDQRLKVRNNRSPVLDNLAKDQFEPYLGGRLWKLKTEGDRKYEPDWMMRDMWIAKNGSLVYWSKKEERELIFHTSAEIARATVLVADYDDGCKRHAFSVRLPPNGDVHVAPSLFAAASAKKRDEWLEAFKKFAYFAETPVRPTSVGRHEKFVGLPATKAKGAPKPAAKPAATAKVRTR